jgi:Zn-dependent protease with chaperone function
MPPTFSTWFSWDVYIVICVIIGLIVGIKTYRAFNQLFDGGAAVLDKLGLKQVFISSASPQERRGSQIVAEMSLAAGCPLPQLYVMRETGINAFSAGWEQSDAAIAVTRGALEQLNREELQALFAHEFSHILNGDMRLNFIMSGLLEGLFFFFQVGSGMLEHMPYRRERSLYVGRIRNSRGMGSVAAVYMGVFIIMLVGGTGYALGRWVQAVMTRQQSLGSDAAAVQFTRNPQSVISLLEKMGRDYINTNMLTSRYEQFSHAFIGAAGKRNILSAHPSLKRRIAAIDPDHNPQFKAMDLTETAPHVDHLVGGSRPPAKQIFMWTAMGLGIAEALRPATAPESDALFDGSAWETPLPEHGVWTETADDARATVFALVCVSQPGELSSRLKQLKPRIDRSIYKKINERISSFQDLDLRYRVPLLELCLSSLRSLSRVQYEAFKTALLILFNTDFKLDHDEFVVQRLIISRLDKTFGIAVGKRRVLRVLGDAADEFGLVLSLVAYTEHMDETAQKAFETGTQSIGATGLKITPETGMNLKRVHEAIETLDDFPPNLKKRLLTACAAIIAMDHKVTPRGFELLRVLAASLEVPTPPITEGSA